MYASCYIVSFLINWELMLELGCEHGEITDLPQVTDIL